MGLLIFLLFFLFELYVAVLMIYVLVLLIRRKKLPVNVLLINVLCLGLLWWLKYEVEEHNIVFTGSYENSPGDWGEGLANMMVSLLNLGIVYVIGLVTQLIFINIFSREFRKLNPGQ